MGEWLALVLPPAVGEFCVELLRRVGGIWFTLGGCLRSKSNCENDLQRGLYTLFKQ